MNKFIEKLSVIGNKMASQRHLQSISYGMMVIMPLTIFGSIFQLISALPSIFPFIPAYSESLSNAILLPFNLTFGIFGIIASVAISYFLARNYKMNLLNASITSLISFLLISGAYNLESNSFDGTFLGSAGIFVAIIVSLITVEITRFLETHNVKIKMPDSIPPVVADSFNAIISLSVNALLAYLVMVLCQNTAGMPLPALIQSILAPALTASESIWFCMIVQGLIALLTCIGVHGFNTLAGIILPLAIANQGINAECLAAGVPATQLFTLSSFQMTGCFYWIIPIMMLRCKSERMKAVGKVSFIPSIFNISEPIQYGAPLVFNPLMAIPFIVINMVNAGIVWCSMYFGLCDKAAVMVSSNIPMPIFQYLVTLDWRSIVVFAVMVVISFLIFKPFMSAYDKQCLEEEKTI